MTQSRLAMETLYEGHVRLTNNLLPLMPQTGYSRILFTTSVVAYNVGGTELGESQGQSFLSAYYSGKRALLAYANNLRGFLRTSGSSTQVSTLNPVVINTGLALGTNPIVTEPVDADGNSPFNPVLQSVIDGFRLALASGVPAEFAAEAYTQILARRTPPANVAVGSRREPFATMGFNSTIIDTLQGENDESALRFRCR